MKCYTRRELEEMLDKAMLFAYERGYSACSKQRKDCPNSFPSRTPEKEIAKEMINKAQELIGE